MYCPNFGGMVINLFLLPLSPSISHLLPPSTTMHMHTTLTTSVPVRRCVHVSWWSCCPTWLLTSCLQACPLITSSRSTSLLTLKVHHLCMYPPVYISIYIPTSACICPRMYVCTPSIYICTHVTCVCTCRGDSGHLNDGLSLSGRPIILPDLHPPYMECVPNSMQRLVRAAALGECCMPL